MARDLIVAPRGLVLPSWLKGRASLYFDPTDDLVAGTIPADLTGAGAWTILGRLRPATFHTATDRGAVSFGTNAAAQGAFLGQVISGSKPYIGGGLIGTTLADSRVASSSEWSDCMIRYAGGAGGALTLVVNGRSTAGVATGNITGTNASLGRLLAAGTCFGGRVCDARILSRAISDAEYDAWRLGTSAPVTTRRLWTCENPGYGTTCHEEIGNTEDAITGATWSPVVPFRRRRIVEDVAAAPLFTGGQSLTVAANDAFNPGAGSFGLMGWIYESAHIANGQPLRINGAGGAYIMVYHSATTDPWAFYVRNDAAALIGAGTAFTTPRRPGQWLHISGNADRATNVITFRTNAAVPSVTAWGAGAVTLDANVMFSQAGLWLGKHNDWLWRKGAVFTWEEIEAHYYDGIVPTAPAGSTQIRWGLREGSGTTVASEPAGYNGTLSAASWTTSTRCKARTAAAARDAA